MTTTPTHERGGLPVQVRYPIHDHTLDNGLRVIISPDAGAPGVAVNLWYRVGSRDEVAGRTGFAHLFEHLMFQGTWTGVSPGEHLAAMQAAGGEANATTSFDRTNYHETVHLGALDLALWLEAQRMGDLRVDQANFDTQRDVVKEEKRQRYDNAPYGDTFSLLTAQHFAAHPYDHTPIGHMADLDAAALSDVQGFYERWYRPSNASLVICGAIEVDDALGRVQQQFGHLPTLDAPRRVTPPALGRHPEAQVRTVHRDVPRDAVHVGWRVPVFHDPAAMALDLAFGILAGTQSSRLHQRLVIDEELAEGISASTLGLDGATNLAIVSARAREGVAVERLEQRIEHELARFAHEGPSADEIERAHAQLERQWLSELATVDSRADAINHFTATLGDPQVLNSHLDDLLALDAESMATAVADWLDPHHSSTLRYLHEEQR